MFCFSDLKPIRGSQLRPGGINSGGQQRGLHDAGGQIRGHQGRIGGHRGGGNNDSGLDLENSINTSCKFYYFYKEYIKYFLFLKVNRLKKGVKLAIHKTSLRRPIKKRIFVLRHNSKIEIGLPAIYIRVKLILKETNSEILRTSSHKSRKDKSSVGEIIIVLSNLSQYWTFL